MRGARPERKGRLMDYKNVEVERGQCMTARERSCQVLRDRARRYHEYAVQLEKLADWAVRLDAAEDEALWNVLVGNQPR